jgi:predicted DCC family thiol-disulfide oxidoreductase YuxK
VSDAIILFNRRFPDSARAVDFVLRWDRRRRFLFATTSSISGRRLLRAYSLDREPLTQPVLLAGGEAYRGTRAWLRILVHLAFPWPFLSAVALLPARWRDRVLPWPDIASSHLFRRCDGCASCQGRFI